MPHVTLITMKPVSAFSETTSWRLDQTLSRIANHPRVDGIMLLGSTGTDALTPTSDYDVLVVFSALPAQLRIVNTWIDGRLAEIYCAAMDTIERVINTAEPWPDASEEATILAWLTNGSIYADRGGILARARTQAAEAPSPGLPGDHAIYEAWRKIGYNVAQIKRYLGADDPVAQTAVDLRLLYSVDEVKVHYFTVRGLPWRGEKPAIRYWMIHDPDFLERLRVYFDESDRDQRVALYEDLARRALAPVAELWGFGETAISPGPGYGTSQTMDDVPSAEEALAFWIELIGRDCPG
jgi:predicted nucleotidyltransferase